MKLLRVPLAAVLGCLLLVAPALGSELNRGPSSSPKTEGPVTQDRSQCSDQSVKSEAGEVLGRAEACVYVFSFDTLSEVDVLREYGAAWLQARFVPAAGWCATDVAMRLGLSGGQSEGTTKAPKERGRVATKLVLDAGGNALEAGSISQKWTAAPGGLGTKPLEGQPGAVTSWSGETAKAVNLVSGVGYSYEMLGGAPESISFGFSRLSLSSC